MDQLTKLSNSEFWHVFWFGFLVGAAVIAALAGGYAWFVTWLDDRREDKFMATIDEWQQFKERMEWQKDQNET